MTDINVIEVREKVRRVGFALRELVQQGQRGTDHTETLAKAVHRDPTEWLPVLRWDGVEATVAWWLNDRRFQMGDALKAAATRAASNNEAAIRQYTEIQGALSQAGVEVLPIKGVALAAGGHLPHLSARLTADVDCLIKESDRDKAQQVLRKLGYTPEEGPVGLPPEDPYAPYRDSYGKPDALPVDVHWRLLPPAVHGGETDDFWKNTVPSPTHGFALPGPRPLFRSAIVCGALAKSWSAFSWRAILDFIWTQGKDLGWGTHREREFQLDVAWLRGNDAVEPTPVALAGWRAWVAAQPWRVDRQADVMAVGIHAVAGNMEDERELKRQAWYLPPAERGGLGGLLRQARSRLAVKRIIKTAERLTA